MSAPLPLVTSQAGLWLVEQWAPDRPVYNIPTVLRLTGHLDPEALVAAVRELGSRHEALHARFELRDGEPVQRLGARAPAPVRRETLGVAPGADRDATLRALIDEEGGRRFDLAGGCLLRALLLDVGPREWVLVLTVHHIVADGWSVGLLLEDLSRLYSMRTGGFGTLPEPGDYRAAVEEAVTAAGAADADLDFWRNELAGLEPLDLPIAAPTGAGAEYEGRTVVHSVPLTGRLTELARMQGCTPYLLTMAGFAALLHRLSGQESFALGTAVNNRLSSEAERVVGLFVTMVALRCDIDGEMSFMDLVRQLRGSVADAVDHAVAPFDRVVQHVGASRESGRNPLFQTAFNYQEEVGDALRLAHVQVAPLDIDLGIARFDLNVVAVAAGENLRVEAEYASARFDAGTVERLLGQYATLLTAGLAEPDRPLSSLPMLPEPERTTVHGWSRPARAVDVPGTLDGLVAEQARRRPDAPAVSGEDGGPRPMTYRELDERANHLAARLRTVGVRPGDRVAVCLRREPVLVVALLAALKAGAAYLPIDPNYPAERVRLLCEDARPTAVLTTDDLRTRLPADLTAVEVHDAARAPEPPPEPASTTDTAYVIYTSGSTGRPKGVRVSHANVVRLFTATDDWFSFTADDVWTCYHSAAFDFSVWEIWGALLSGAQVVLVSEELARDPAAFRDLLARRRVTVLSQTPAAFRQLSQVETTRAEPPDLSLRTVVFGGEALDYGSLRPWFDRYGDDRPALVNMYGITETTVHVTYRRVRSADAREPGGQSPIGVPIPDLSVRVVDRYGNDQPIGVAGEMLVGGAGVADGYLNRPELTAQRFGTHPETGERFYRSGDLAARLPSGELDYRGRADQQVKVRGYRIEPGEVQAAIGEFPGVHESFVTVMDDDGDRRLVAYVVARPEPDADDLRRHLTGRLPAHLVPQLLIFLPRLPLTGNGKVDRTRLPGPGAEGSAGRTSSPPRTDLERLVAEVVADVVPHPVGVHDDFFTLGGTSLGMARVLAALRQRTGVRLSVREFFGQPTVAGLATAIAPRAHTSGTGSRRSARRADLVPLRTGTGRPMFCVHPSGGTALCYLTLAAVLPGTFPMVGVQAVGLDGDTAPLGTVEEMAAHYRDRIVHECPTGPVDLLGWSYGGVVAFETARLLREQDRPTRVVLLDAPAPDPEPEPERADLLTRFAADIAAMTGTVLPADLDMRTLAPMDPREQLVAVHQALCRCGALTPETDVDQLSARAEVFVANLRALARYRPTGTYDDPLMLVRAAESPDLSWAWSAHSAAGIADVVVPGDHYSLVDQEIGVTAAHIDAWLTGQLQTR
ncbi:amino acid adenylation domain-containing protein [Streptomyces sp. G44]|uniref:non-ribosomal peptide synthetase n=1 Tax=Streptomyces sp. G44 TaxID=2807632 RepID=UPI00195F6937|nr:non-ribosomal peptide synthetase [Streptomyces sp. G44]MBM7168897.1 amino acid adenylation domain-containing protein [Streptomyces sp. G44]